MLIIQRLTLGRCCSVEKPVIQVRHSLASEVAQTIQREIPHVEASVSKITTLSSVKPKLVKTPPCYELWDRANRVMRTLG